MSFQTGVAAMPEVIDWRTIPDPHQAIQSALTALRAGRVVVLPTEAGYVVAADALASGASEHRRQLSLEPNHPWSLALSSEVVARDWVPVLSRIGRRFVRRLWPGPVTLQLAELPARVSETIRSQGPLSLRSPAHEVIRELLRELPESLLLADLPPLITAEPATGSRLAEALAERVAMVIDDGPVRFPEGPTVVSVNGDRWQVLREAAVPAALIERQAVCLIVFVCTGNTCRSPLAEALCKKRLSDRLACAPEELPQRGYMVLSAGLAAYGGGSAAVEAVEVASSYGADLSGHRSRGLSAELLLQADYVLGMTQDHVEAMAEASAGLTEPPRLLSADGDDLADPVGQARAVYEECAAAIWKHLDHLTAEIVAVSPPRPANP